MKVLHTSTLVAVIILLLAGCSDERDLVRTQERVTELERRLAVQNVKMAELEAKVDAYSLMMEAVKQEALRAIDTLPDRLSSEVRTDICDRSIPMQSTLLKRYNIGFCSAVSTGELNRLQDLELAGGPELEASDFKDMDNLKSLRLYAPYSGADASSNDAKRPQPPLSSDLFSHISTLQELELDGYSLTSVLAVNYASELPNLERLTLEVRTQHQGDSRPMRKYTLRFNRYGDVCLSEDQYESKHHDGANITRIAAAFSLTGTLPTC